MPYTFSVYLWILMRWQIAYNLPNSPIFSPTKILPCTVFIDSNFLLETHTLTAIKLRPLSVARALAIIVLLQPGGPYNNTPLGGSMLISVNAYLFMRVPSQDRQHQDCNLGVLQRPLNWLLEFLLYMLLASNVRPKHLGNFYGDLSHGSWPCFPQGCPQVSTIDTEIIQQGLLSIQTHMCDFYFCYALSSPIPPTVCVEVLVRVLHTELTLMVRKLLLLNHRCYLLCIVVQDLLSHIHEQHQPHYNDIWNNETHTHTRTQTHTYRVIQWNLKRRTWDIHRTLWSTYSSYINKFIWLKNHSPNSPRGLNSINTLILYLVMSTSLKLCGTVFRQNFNTYTIT